jgi:hypothetical protein
MTSRESLRAGTSGESIMNPRDAEDVRQTLCRAVLDRWPIPAIDGTDGTYYKSSTRSEFTIDSFGSKFVVTVEQIA